MLKRVIILDGNHIAYRAYYKFPNLRTFDGIKTSLIYGMPYVVESLIRKLGPDKAIMVFDGGRSPIRLGLLPSYKEKEKKIGFDAENFYSQKDIGRDLLIALGIETAWERKTEADDIITMIAKDYSKKGFEVVIVSGDKDFNQLITKRVGDRGNILVFNTKNGKLIDDYDLVNIIGYNPRQHLDFLILTGDKSDNIPGYPGIGPVKAEALIKKFGSIKKFLIVKENFLKIDKPKLREIYDRNKKLIDLTWYYKTYSMGNDIPWLPYNSLDIDLLKELCRKYQINSFLKPQFLNTFKNIIK